MGEDNRHDETVENETNDIEEFGQSVIKDGEATIYLISIIGEIEGHECLPSNSKTTKYEHVLPKLAEIEDDKKIDGVLLTMVDGRTNFAKDISFMLRSNYGDKLRIFDAEIPLTIKAAEISAEGKSIFAYDKRNKAALAYEMLTKEVMDGGKQRQKHEITFVR